MVLVGSQYFSVLLVGSHRLSVVLSCGLVVFMVVMGSQRFLYVLIDFHRLSMVLTGSQWFS